MGTGWSSWWTQLARAQGVEPSPTPGVPPTAEPRDRREPRLRSLCLPKGRRPRRALSTTYPTRESKARLRFGGTRFRYRNSDRHRTARTQALLLGGPTPLPPIRFEYRWTLDDANATQGPSVGLNGGLAVLAIGFGSEGLPRDELRRRNAVLHHWWHSRRVLPHTKRADASPSKAAPPRVPLFSTAPNRIGPREPPWPGATAPRTHGLNGA